ncbi:MAG: DUF91 domain-containing protein [Halobacteriaceae archaeon]
MQDAIRVLAGHSTVTYDGDDRRTVRGRVLTLVKPDGTVLVHDAAGYRPAAWLTRPDTVAYDRDDGASVHASDGDRVLRVTCPTPETAHFGVSRAGPPVGACPDCGAALVRDGARVVCTGCLAAYGVPRDATVTGETCERCGLPTVRVDRGAAVTVCVDRTCDPLVEAVRDRVAGEWACRCGADLCVRQRRGLRAVCDACDATWAIPTGVADGTCACGLPLFDVGDGRRCLDPHCERAGGH